jgi:hypothetical protein
MLRVAQLPQWVAVDEARLELAAGVTERRRERLADQLARSLLKPVLRRSRPLRGAGHAEIELAAVKDALERDGVPSFRDSYDQLIPIVGRQASDT